LIKEQPTHLHWAGAPFIAGAVPFVAAFIELAFILSSFWQGRVYYVFGFVALVYIVVVVVVAETTIVVVYFTLVSEDYRWWWRSFASGAALGLHLFLYSLYYLRSHLPIRQPTSVILYIGYMGIISFIVACFAGSVAFVSCFMFVRKIYGSIRID
jgi:transmembrane 9 superfamily protein 2/4